MNKIFSKLLTLTISLIMIFGFTPKIINAQTEESPKQRAVGYYPYYGDLSSIDVNKLTNLFYAFGYIYHKEDLPPGTTYDPSKTNNQSLLGEVYLNEQIKAGLKRIPELKLKNTNLKASLSLGGYAGRGFCDATATKESRNKTVQSIVKIINEYSLDGIDIDWEVPVNGGWGTIKYCEDDKVNYTLFLEDLRIALGNDKLITIAAGAGYEFRYNWTEFVKIGEIVDFMTIMNYDYAYSGPKYNSPLYSSSKDPYGFSTNDVIADCINIGVPKEKIVMGAAAYGRIPTHNGQPNYINKNLLINLGFTQADTAYSYGQIINFIGKNGIEERWDDEAKNPYLVYVDPNTKEEHFILQYENPKSLSIKGRYVRDKGLGGIMLWETTQDVQNKLLNSIFSGLYTNISLDKNPDLNMNNVIDIIDLSIISSKYNSSYGNHDFNAIYDLNNDNIIDIFDLTILARHITN